MTKIAAAACNPIPGILISGYTDVAALVDALNLGKVRGYLPKPWDIQQ